MVLDCDGPVSGAFTQLRSGPLLSIGASSSMKPPKGTGDGAGAAGSFLLSMDTSSSMIMPKGTGDGDGATALKRLQMGGVGVT